MIDRRLACLPQPSQMRPPETEARARDIFRRVSLRVMQPMAGSPRRRRARSVEHRKENQHAARPRIQLERSMRNRAMVTDRRAEGLRDLPPLARPELDREVLRKSLREAIATLRPCGI